MVFRLSRIGIPPGTDPHGWQSWDNYRTVQDIRLAQNPFVVRYLDTLANSLDDEAAGLIIRGIAHCQKDVALRVSLSFEYDRGHLPHRVRCQRFAYVGWQVGGNLLLKYHNLHANPDDYIHRVYNPDTGKQILYERLERYQFPTFSEVPGELESLALSL